MVEQTNEDFIDLRRKEVERYFFDFLSMNPWMTKPPHDFEYIDEDFFRENVVTGIPGRDVRSGRATQALMDFQDRIKDYPCVHVFGHRGTGKSTFVRYAVKHDLLIDFETADRPGDPGGGISSKERVRRIFSSFLKDRLTGRLEGMSGAYLDAKFWDPLSINVLHQLETWIVDFRLWDAVSAGDQLKRLRNASDLWFNAFHVDGTTTRALTEVKVEDSLISLEPIDLCVMSVVVAAAFAITKNARTVVIFDNLDQLDAIFLAGELFGSADATINALHRRFKSTMYKASIGNLRVVLVTRTRNFSRALHNGGGADDLRDRAICLNGVFNPVEILQQRYRAMITIGLKHESVEDLGKLKTIIEILSQSPDLSDRLVHLFNGNYRTFIDYLYPALVKWKPRAATGDPSGWHRTFNQVRDYLKPKMGTASWRAKNACAQSFVMDRVFLEIMGANRAGHVYGHELTAKKRSGKGANQQIDEGKLNLARVMLGAIYNETRSEVDEPFSNTYPLSKLFRELSPLFDHHFTDIDIKTEIADCLLQIHGNDRLMEWARAVHIDGIKELTSKVIIEAASCAPNNVNAAFVQLSWAGRIYLESVLPSISVFVAKHTNRKLNRHLCEVLFDDLGAESITAFVNSVIQDAVKALERCCRDLRQFADIRIMGPHHFASMAAVSDSNLVMEGKFFQERMATAFRAAILDFGAVLKEEKRDVYKTVEPCLIEAAKVFQTMSQRAIDWRHGAV